MQSTTSQRLLALERFYVDVFVFTSQDHQIALLNDFAIEAFDLV